MLAHNKNRRVCFYKVIRSRENLSHKIFPMDQSHTTRKPQARTEATKEKILDAAQSLFGELGFENTQLEEVATHAGCSRGAIYAHYKSKEDLFLALMEHRAAASFKALCKRLEEEPDRKKRWSMFKAWFLQQVTAPEAGTLALEYKLYAMRRPEMRDRLLDLYNSLFMRTDQDLREVLFGERLTKTERIAIEQRLAVLGGAVSALILERHFRPALFTTSNVRQLAEEMFDALLQRK